MSVALLIVTGASLGASSCHWLRYHDLARTHVDLLEQIADDVGAALDVVDYRMKPGDLQTMAYPLERAMAFVEESRRARAQLQSHQRLAAFVEAYKALYEYLDRVRSVRQEEGGTRTVNALIAVVNEHAAAVRAAIDEETG
jgi:cell fate (sporulation/competence/biofilm development) regulator YlbF (YheA/YmcA/DUF963 family)